MRKHSITFARPDPGKPSVKGVYTQARVRTRVSGMSVRHHALIVGVNAYDNLEVLRYALNDAHALAEAFKPHCDSVQVLEDPSRDAFSKVMRQC